MGLLSVALLAAIRTSSVKARGVLELTIAGSTLRYADSDYPSEGSGYYAGRVKSWGMIGRSLSDSQGSLTTPSATVVLDDTTLSGETQTSPPTLRAFDAAFMGVTGRYLQDAPAVIKIAHPDVASASWCTVFSGRVVDCQKVGLSYELSLELDVRWLDTPYGQELINTVDWPNAHPSAVGLVEPVRYGEIDATNAGGKGSVVCPCVDTVGGRYLFSRGVCKSGGPDRVYEDDVLTVAAYTRSVVVVNGKHYTLIDFTTPPAADVVITADGYGLTEEGTTGGTLISNPIDVIDNFVTNFVLRSHKTGAYTALDSHFDSATWATMSAGATAFGIVAGADFSEPGTVRDLLKKFLDQFRIRAWFTPAGALAIAPWDHSLGSATADDIYPSTHLTQDDDVADSFKLSFTRRVFQAVIAKWQTVRGRSGHQWEARDQSVLTPATLPLDLNLTVDSGTQAEVDGRTARYVTSVALNELRDQQMFASMTCPLWRVDIDILTDIIWSHPHAPSSGTGAGPGWGTRRDQARQMRVTGVELDLNNLRVKITAQDVRWFLTSLWQADRFSTPSSAWESGNARLDRGAVTARTYTRASLGWIGDPASGLVRERAIDSQMMTGLSLFSAAGRVIERASLNYLKQCAGSLTGWSTTGTVALEATSGIGSTSDVAADATTCFWATAVVANCVKLGTAASTFSRTTSAIPNQFIRLWAVVSSEGAQPVLWQFQRLSDNKYWRDSDSTWQVAATDNQWSLNGPTQLVKSKVIDLGGAGVAASLTFKNTAADTARLFQLQVDTNPWVGSPILTTTAEVTRSAGLYAINNDTGQRTWPNTRGTLICEGQPWWDKADDTATRHTLFSVTYDASNWYKLYYDCSDGKVKFERRAAGTTVTATYTVDLVNRVVYGFAARWCSSVGELGMAAYTISVFFRSAAGVWAKGTDAIGAAIPTQVNTVNIRYGDVSGATDHWDGVIRQPWITPIVYTDEEIARRLGSG
jgi:hypothetical protein